MNGWWTVAFWGVLDAALWIASTTPPTERRAAHRLRVHCRTPVMVPPRLRAERPRRGTGGLEWPMRALRERLTTRRRAGRGRALLVALPDVLDILTICLRAGLSLHAAVAEYAKTATGIGADVFRWYLAELAMGRAAEDALEDLASRYPADEISALASTIAQSLRVGAPLADVFEVQAAHCRAMALHRAREAAQRLSTQLVLPLVAFIFPVVFIVGLGPVALRVARLVGVLR